MRDHTATPIPYGQQLKYDSDNPNTRKSAYQPMKSLNLSRADPLQPTRTNPTADIQELLAQVRNDYSLL